MNGDVIYPGLLPPCRVCGSKATGLHYGVNTCEACKAFFRRSYDKGHLFECPAHRSCKLDGKSRNTCAYCRYQKCLELGMRKDAIKSGRLTHEQRSSNIREIRNLAMYQGENTAEKSNNSPELCGTITGELLRHGEEINSLNSAEGHNTMDTCSELTELTGEYLDADIGNAVGNMVNISNDSNADSIVDVEMYDESTPQNTSTPIQAQKINMPILVVQGVPQNSPNAQVEGKLFDPSRIHEYEKTIKKLSDLYVSFDAEHQAMIATENVEDKGNQYLEMLKLQELIFGPLQPVPVEEYLKFYKETGIDVDGRRKLMEEALFPQMEMGIKQLAKFAKSIPYFTELSVDNQINLIKACRLDFIIFTRSKWYNPENKIFVLEDGKVYHKSDILKVKESAFVEMVFPLFERIISLNLSSAESAIICAINTMAADSCNLENAELVERSHEFLVECLFYLFNEQGEGHSRFSSVINCLTQLRTVREHNYKDEEGMLSLWCDQIEIPPVLYELWSP